MFTNVQVINLGLAKIGSSRVRDISPPRTSLEQHCAEGYQMWKRTELAKHRWVFATEYGYALTITAELEREDGLRYKYGLPTDCLRPLRSKYTTWVQAGRFVYSECDTLAIDYIRNVPEADFDPLFVDVLAARVALESVEYVTQSNTKKADTDALYDRALNAAKKANAFTRGPEDIQSDDCDFSFITARE